MKLFTNIHLNNIVRRPWNSIRPTTRST